MAIRDFSQLGNINPFEIRRIEAIYFFFLLIAVGFVIYIPSHLLKTTAPLLLQDVLLGISLFLVLARKRLTWNMFGGSRSTTGFALLLIAAIGVSTINSGVEPIASYLRGVRSILFFVVAVFVATEILDTPKKIELGIRIVIVGALVSALWGVRQAMFGLAQFELDQLSMIGASVREIEVLGRTRIPSTFGDPWTFVFACCAGVMLLVASYRFSLPGKTRATNYVVLFVVLLTLLTGAVIGLTRTPLAGLVVALVGMYFLGAKFDRSLLVRTSVIVLLLVVGLVILDRIVVSEVLSKSSNSTVNLVGDSLDSVWSMVPSQLTSQSSDSNLGALQSYSRNARFNELYSGFQHLLKNPLGAGIHSDSVDSFPFTLVDIGVLRYGVEAGWLGLIAILGFWSSIFISSCRRTTNRYSPAARAFGFRMLAIWIGLTVTLFVTPFLHVEVMAVWTATIAGILLNLHVVDSQSHSGEEHFHCRGVI